MKTKIVAASLLVACVGCGQSPLSSKVESIKLPDRGAQPGTKMSRPVPPVGANNSKALPSWRNNLAVFKAYLDKVEDKWPEKRLLDYAGQPDAKGTNYLLYKCSEGDKEIGYIFIIENGIVIKDSGDGRHALERIKP